MNLAPMNTGAAAGDALSITVLECRNERPASTDAIGQSTRRLMSQSCVRRCLLVASRFFCHPLLFGLDVNRRLQRRVTQHLLHQINRYLVRDRLRAERVGRGHRHSRGQDARAHRSGEDTLALRQARKSRRVGSSSNSDATDQIGSVCRIARTTPYKEMTATKEA